MNCEDDNIIYSVDSEDKKWKLVSYNKSKIQNEMYNIHYSLYLNSIKGFDIEWEDEWKWYMSYLHRMQKICQSWFTVQIDCSDMMLNPSVSTHLTSSSSSVKISVSWFEFE